MAKTFSSSKNCFITKALFPPLSMSQYLATVTYVQYLIQLLIESRTFKLQVFAISELYACELLMLYSCSQCIRVHWNWVDPIKINATAASIKYESICKTLHNRSWCCLSSSSSSSVPTWFAKHYKTLQTLQNIAKLTCFAVSASQQVA